MKRQVWGLGVLGLLYAVALPASAAVLYQDDFSTDKLVKDKATYMEGANPQILADPSNPFPPFYIPTDASIDAAIAPDARSKGWLATVSADGTAGNDLNEDDTRTVPELLLFGDPAWADVAIQAKIVSHNQTTGAVSLVLRAAPKTKEGDPNSRYELRYQSDVGVLLASEVRDGIPANDTDTTVTQDGSTVVPISLRILKLVKGKWTLLAKQDAATAAGHIPRINNGGVDHDAHVSADGDDGTEPLTGGFFRFVAKGDLLQGFVSRDGVNFTKVIEARDAELKAGRAGFMQYDYIPLFDNLVVEDAP